MNNKFDEIIKSQLESIQVDPSKRSTRILGFKLFFLNLLQFHKAKVAVGVSAIAIATTFFFLNTSSENEKKVAVANNTEKNEVNKSTAEIIEVETNESLSGISAKDEKNGFVADRNSNVLNNEESIDLSNKLNENSENMLSVLAEGNESKNVTKQSSGESLSNTNKYENNLQNGLKTESPVNRNVEAGKEKEQTSNDILAEKHSDSQNQNVNLTKEINQVNENTFEADVLDPKMIVSNVEGELSTNVPPFEMNEDDYANNPKTRGLSIDAYYTVLNNTKINNSIQDGSVYYWDFYKNTGFINSGMKGGLNINYMYNGFKFGTGVGYNQINEVRPNYQYVYDTTTFVPFGGYTVSGTMVYEQDTTLILYTPHTKDVTDAFNSKNNQYRYITIPLSLGYEVYFGKLSFEANAGILYQRLIGVSGLSVKVDDFNNEAKNIFYYKDRYMTTLNNNKNTLSKNLINMNLNFITRFKVSSHLDLFAGFNYGTSANALYKKSYFVKKQVQNYGINFGVTYHLSQRL